MALILGGSGQLGSAFRRLLPDAAAPSRDELDLVDIALLEPSITSLGPDLIINCAAYADVDAAEGDGRLANALNGEAVGELSRTARRLGIPFVTFSSDYVFDGMSNQPYVESSPPAPINAYGRSKLLGEQLALQYSGSLVVRTSWLLSATHPNFVRTILARAAVETVAVVDDQRGRPTLVSDLAVAVLDAVDRGYRGLLHLASPPATTWFRLAEQACAAAGIDATRVAACATEDYPSRAQRPRYSVLASERGEILPDWRVGLPELVAQILGPGSPSGIRPADPPNGGGSR